MARHKVKRFPGGEMRGPRSLMAAQAFRASGYDAYSLRGGLARWVDEGHPLSPHDGYVADH